MNIELNHSKSHISNSNFIKKLGGALEQMQYFSVDRQEGKYTILQNTYTHKIYEVKTSKLPPFLNDGDILKKSGFNYEFDLQKTNEIKSKMKNLMKNASL